MLGTILIFILLGLSVYTAVAYFLSSKHEGMLKKSRGMYYAIAGLIFFISALHMGNILSHSFEYHYVWSYSSRELSPLMLMSSFYAGQEGSFLLWTFFTGLFGLFALSYAKKRDYEWQLMGFYVIIIAFLALMLIAKNPFQFIWEAFPNVKEGTIPPNGRGLNPVLENYWMSIHPPILFFGFAAMTVPFCFALAALLKREYKNWINIALPWFNFAATVLGFGIMLGGFWAYETLGWGGFWGWDPVENSSLLPWMAAVAAIHTLLVQKKTGGLIKTNFVITFVSYIFVIYSTFLTRSGILGDTSVHSFAEPGNFVYAILLSVLIIVSISGFVFMIIRRKDLITDKMNFAINSKEFIITIGTIFLLAATAVVFFGTSWPIISGIFSGTKSSVDSAFYNKWTLPLAVVMLALNSISFYSIWNKTDWSQKSGKLLVIAITALIISIIFFFLGIKDFFHLLLIFTTFAVIVQNIIFFITNRTRSITRMGHYISHFGISIFLLGALLLADFSESSHATFTKNSVQSVIGHNFKYVDKQQIEIEKKDREKYKYIIKIDEGAKESIVEPIIYWSMYNDMQSPFFEPGISRGFFKDIYISPKSVEYNDPSKSVTLGKGDSAALPGLQNFKLQLIRFDMSHIMAASDSAPITLGTIVNFIRDSQLKEDTITSQFDMSSGAIIPIWKPIDTTGYEIGFMKFVIDKETIGNSKAIFSFRKIGEKAPEQVETLYADISTKPMINLVWFGVLAIVAGFFLAGLKHMIRQKPVTVQAHEVAPGTPAEPTVATAKESVSDSSEEE
ncbi:MAG: ccmF [Ignavibacteria bacterium]|nr:ccmF [Ignavibacteria bacterium]